jgi:hypothetical protein
VNALDGIAEGDVAETAYVKQVKQQNFAGLTALLLTAETEYAAWMKTS